MQEARLRIHGRVQGVGFRWHTRRKAVELGVTGWVRNADDGSVEAVAIAEPEVLERFIAWCREGPPASRVTRVETAFQEPTTLHESFEVWH